MPIPGARYRWVKKGGKMIRLAFVGNKVVEVKEKGKEAKRIKA
jgi:hypothetical protein